MALRSAKWAAALLPALLSANLHGARILLVVDNQVNQELALALLGEASIDVSVAGNGQA